MNNLKNAIIAIMVVIALVLVSCENEPIDTVIEETSAIGNTQSPELNTVPKDGNMLARSSSCSYPYKGKKLKGYVKGEQEIT